MTETNRSNSEQRSHSAAKPSTKQEASANLSPATAENEPTHDEIAARAYQRWQERGSEHGSQEADWLTAEQELRADRNRGADKPQAAAASTG